MIHEDQFRIRHIDKSFKIGKQAINTNFIEVTLLINGIPAISVYINTKLHSSLEDAIQVGKNALLKMQVYVDGFAISAGHLCFTHVDQKIKRRFSPEISSKLISLSDASHEIFDNYYKLFVHLLYKVTFENDGSREV